MSFENVKSSIETPAQFVKNNALFSIPSYQRPYVWSDEAIKTLFDDLYSAYIHKLPHYYVGTILTAKSDNGRFELIDGQQRTTTLMLLALACKNKNKKKEIDSNLKYLICTSKGANGSTKPQLRLSFKIRDQVEAYLGHMAGIADYDNKFPSEADIKKNPYLKRLAGGLATLENLLEQITDSKKREEFANYVYENMRMVNNQIPRSTDLNQLFATMNNSGIQLEQVDILKSLLFKNIHTDKVTYNSIWQVCENMSNYFERNVRQVFPQTQWDKLNATDFSQFDVTRFLLKENEKSYAEKSDSDNNNGLTISEIIARNQASKNSTNSGEDKKPDEDEKPEVYCRSIISFSQLLLHAYRIYLHKNKKDDFEPRFHTDQLIDIFKPLVNDGKENEIKDFIKVLWQVRYAFDAKIVKWVEQADENEEQLILCKINGPYLKDKYYYFNRSSLEHSELSLLQMVRHFTTDRNSQYWLTPYLAWLVENPEASDKELLIQLESLDNQLSLAKIEQKPASYLLLSRKLSKEIENAEGYFDKYFNEIHGVRFRHYWFQKLEYLLYKHQKDYLPNIDANKFKQYRIISRNSVEHVHPQHEEHGGELGNDTLNSFGNLALLNVSQNSAYSNQVVAKKRIDFESKSTFDSLKLKHIFDLMGNDKWDKAKIEKHQKTMIKLLKNHYKDSATNYDFVINDSSEELIDIVNKTDKPIILWGHTGVGKSSLVSDIADSLKIRKINLNTTDFIIHENHPIIHKGILENIENATPCLIDFEWSNKSEEAAIHMQEILESNFIKQNKIILCTHPVSKGQNIELLGSELIKLSSQDFNDKTPSYTAYPFSDSVISECINIAVYPSVVRWLSWAKNNTHEVISNFIESLYYSENPQLAYKALYGFLFDGGWNSSSLSPSRWQDMSRKLTSNSDFKNKMLYQRNFLDFNQNILTYKNEWILKNEEFQYREDADKKIRSITGLDEIIQTIKNSDDYESMKFAEMKAYFGIYGMSFIEKNSDISKMFIEFVSNYLIKTGVAL